jgi:hypothetical protein
MGADVHFTLSWDTLPTRHREFPDPFFPRLKAASPTPPESKRVCGAIRHAAT